MDTSNMGISIQSIFVMLKDIFLINDINFYYIIFAVFYSRSPIIILHMYVNFNWKMNFFINHIFLNYRKDPISFDIFILIIYNKLFSLKISNTNWTTFHHVTSFFPITIFIFILQYYFNNSLIVFQATSNASFSLSSK